MLRALEAAEHSASETRGPELLATTLGTIIQSGDLMGRFHALTALDEERSALARFAEPRSVRPEDPSSWSDLQPRALTRAVDFLERKELLSAGRFAELADQYRSAGFSIAGSANKAMLGIARDSLADSLRLGADKQLAALRLNLDLEAAGYAGLAPYHARLVAHMAFANGYGRASWDALHDPKLRGIIPAFQYRTREDFKVRESHAAMNRKIFRRNWSGWLEWWPPNDYNCRCFIVGVTARTISTYGLELDTEWPLYIPEGKTRAIRARPPEAFRGNPGTFLKAQAKKGRAA